MRRHAFVSLARQIGPIMTQSNRDRGENDDESSTY